MSMQTIITEQTIPYLVVVPFAALLFFISALAEVNRSPFDLMEAESEIVAGFHIEYSGMKFGMFFLAEFISTLFMAALFNVVFLGGWRFYLLEWISGLAGGDLSTQSLLINGWNLGPLLGMATFAVKTFAVYMVFIWVRGTLPRMRIDQMMDFNWKLMVPASAFLLAVVAIIDRILPADTPVILETLAQIGGNLIVATVVLEIIRRYGLRQRLLFETRMAAHQQQRGSAAPSGPAGGGAPAVVSGAGAAD
jgi:NADH-quinone oxidoreductase subunit H